MRRLTMAVGAMAVLAVLAIVVVPGRHGKKDARTILSEVAAAMENVTSIRLSDRELINEDGKWLVGRKDMWLSPRQMSIRLVWGEPGVEEACSVRADSLEWWVCELNTVYRADVTAYQAQVRDALARATRFYTSAGIKDMLQENWKQIKQSVTYETRDGHEIALLTFDFEKDVPAMRDRPAAHIVDRFVYEVDTTADRLLAIRRYYRYPDGKEVQVEDTDQIEYNAPMPTDAQLLQGIKEPKNLPGGVAVRAVPRAHSLVFTVDGRPFLEGGILTTLVFLEKGDG